MAEITEVLNASRHGDHAAEARLLDVIWKSLYRIAQGKIAHEGQDSLSPTGLVNEAYLRLFAGEDVEWANRRHFYAAASRAMRHLLVDRARKRKAARHGGGQAWVEFRDDVASPGTDEDVLRLNDALLRFQTLHPRAGKVVEMRFFAGYSIAETAELLDVSAGTVKNDWAFARAWLHDDLAETDDTARRTGT
ncbi:MAG: RNA polymerase subunit sigma [Gemmatimonadetes bacterium]|nr:RNA polymerase subunit sigma [Gemmatimonadota bacterium]